MTPEEELSGVAEGLSEAPVGLPERISRLPGETLWYILKGRQRQAGIEGVTPHSFRRAHVSALLEAGVDLLTVQNLVEHANAVTTARYDRRVRAGSEELLVGFTSQDALDTELLTSRAEGPPGRASTSPTALR